MLDVNHLNECGLNVSESEHLALSEIAAELGLAMDMGSYGAKVRFTSMLVKQSFLSADNFGMSARQLRGVYDETNAALPSAERFKLAVLVVGYDAVEELRMNGVLHA